ncbi:MAG: DUF1566 domain-containing protein, partial [Gammaproteobacteria bacterium]|nr:DUF1566 domain-containing protein [Gammaproteobacteria bacterium]
GGSCNDSENCDTEKYAATVNAVGLCGATNWLIPTREQLLSIVDYSIAQPGPTIDTSYFPNTSGTKYWSSSPYAYGGNGAWDVDFEDRDDNGSLKSNTYQVMLVQPVDAIPTADAGDDQIVDEQTIVTLDGTGSNDDLDNGSITSYLWSQISGTTVVLTDADTATATFTTPDVSCGEILTFQLIVTDNEGETHSNETSVTVTDVDNPEDTVADAGASQFVVSGEAVMLDASGSLNVECSTYSWSQTDSTEVAITLNDNTAQQPTFTAPILTAAETVTFEVTVTDTVGFSGTATVSIAIVPVINELINDTGITLCGDYADNSNNSSNTEDCADPDRIDADGDPIPEGQDADYGRDADTTANDDSDGSAGFSYTKLDEFGDPLAQSALSWSCVKDNVTGLIWEVKTTDDGLQDVSHSYSWYNSTGSNDGGGAGTANGGSCNDSENCDTEKYAATVNAVGLCGATNWLIPTREQLLSIVDYS